MPKYVFSLIEYRVREAIDVCMEQKPKKEPQAWTFIIICKYDKMSILLVQR